MNVCKSSGKMFRVMQLDVDVDKENIQHTSSEEIIKEDILDLIIDKILRNLFWEAIVKLTNLISFFYIMGGVPNLSKITDVIIMPKCDKPPIYVTVIFLLHVVSK